MKLALLEAQKGKDTWQNPQVGAVIVKNGQVLSKGHHETYGQAHAEVNALNNLLHLSDAQNATLYVTLEPCSHFGKTPPCVKRIVEVGIKKVVIGDVDPNPQVCGRGIKYLESHGIEVIDLRIHAQINQAYNFFHEFKRPLITVKYAMSLDGKINQTFGQRTIISNQTSFLDSQKLRSKNQAILVGENTFRIDDPQLTVRKTDLKFPPIRIVLIKDINTVNLGQRIFSSPEPIWFLSSTRPEQEFPKNVQIYTDQWSVEKIVEFLFKKGIQSLLVEGGSSIQADFVEANLIDKLIVYLAPKFLGQGLPAINKNIGKVMKFSKPEIVWLDNDLKLTAWRER